MSCGTANSTPSNANYSAANGTQVHVDGSYEAPSSEEPGCPPEDSVDPPADEGWGFGIEVGVTLVAPVFSGGGGTVGLNIQYTSDNGLAIYGISPTNEPSEGFSVGAGVSVNVASGNGPWSGPFDSWGGNLGPASGSHFESAPGSSAPGEGYSGYSGGVGVGAPVGAAYTQTNYTPLVGE